MAFTNIPPNLQDIFYSITDRIAKLETGPNQAMDYAQSAQSTASDASTSAAAASAAAALANTQATTAIALAGTKNTVFYSGTTPTANAVNDQWINTAQGNKLYIWTGSAWVSVQDTAIAAAQSAATAAQTTADGKNKIYRQGTTPTGSFSVGDLWFNTSSDNVMSRWDGSSWVSTTLGNNALYGNISANKLTSGSIDASVINVSNINAGNISTGYLASARIAAGTITGSQLVANTITASQIATGTITATQIAAGTITATEISSSYVYAGTINASQINAGTLTGFLVQTSSGSTSVSMDATYNAVRFKNSGSYVGAIVPLSSNGIIMHYGSTPDGSGGTRPQMYVGSTVVSLQADTSNIVSASTAGVSLTGSTNLNGSTYAVGNRTGTTSTANTYFNSSTGYWTYTTSSQRYKVEIQPQDIPLDSILALQPKSYIDKNEYEENGNKSDGLQRLLGLIAEDVIQIPVIGEMLANRNEEGQPESVNYDRVAIALIPLLKDLNDRITKLEGK